jgi:hypothetical protein
MSTKEGTAIQLYPIGTVRNSGESFAVEITAPFRPALKQLDQFSHVIVLWWADQIDNQQSRSHLQTRPFNAEEHLTGVFACRAEYRPNPIGATVCKICTATSSALAFNSRKGILKPRPRSSLQAVSTCLYSARAEVTSPFSSTISFTSFFCSADISK